MSASGRTEAERARLHEMMAVGEAERSVADVRIADLKAAQEAARRRYIAAKGLVTRARKDGNAEKIATAVTRERQAYANFIAVSDASIDEMFVINGAGLERLGDLLEQVDRAWDADADAVREIEAGDLWLGSGVKHSPLRGLWHAVACVPVHQRRARRVGLPPPPARSPRSGSLARKFACH